MYRIRGVNFLHEEMNSISNMLSFRSSMDVICTCCVGEIFMNKILFKPNIRKIMPQLLSNTPSYIELCQEVLVILNDQFFCDVCKLSH